MNELSLYILDLVQNSVSAGATRIVITVCVSAAEDRLTVTIEDNGCGMEAEFLKRAISPFTTTRTTRKVGLGLPMIKQLCEMCDGTFDAQSQVGVGTKLTLTFRLTHVDLPPMGNLAETMRTLIIGSPEKIDFCLHYSAGGEAFVFDTVTIREALGGVSLNTPDVLIWIRDYLIEGIDTANQAL